MLNINPSPYILTEAVLVNIGGTMFSISSIPNILITTYANISFLDFFLNVGGFSLIVFVFTIKEDLSIPAEGSQVLREFNIWNLVQNKRLLYQSTIAIILVMVLFIAIPSSIITPDIIALTIAMVLVIISKLKPELILYLLGIFVIAGAFEILGIANVLGNSLFSVGSGDLFVQLIIILWISSFLSSAIDNIPITKVLIPVIGGIPNTGNVAEYNQKFYSLAIGANWGDNLTPLGDNILVVHLAEQNKRPISFKQFFKIGFTTTLYQLAIITIIFTLIFRLLAGIITITVILLTISILYMLSKKGPKPVQLKLNQYIRKIKNMIIK